MLLQARCRQQKYENAYLADCLCSVTVQLAAQQSQL